MAIKMIIEPKLLNTLVCPVTRLPVSILDDTRLGKLNELIQAGNVMSIGGEVISDPIEAGLITENGTTIYPVENNIPIMLEDRSIATIQFEGGWIWADMPKGRDTQTTTERSPIRFFCRGSLGFDDVIYRELCLVRSVF